jgi:hypothetical protein
MSGLGPVLSEVGPVGFAPTFTPPVAPLGRPAGLPAKGLPGLGVVSKDVVDN